MIGAMPLLPLYVFVAWTETTMVLLLNDHPENTSLCSPPWHWAKPIVAASLHPELAPLQRKLSASGCSTKQIHFELNIMFHIYALKEYLHLCSESTNAHLQNMF
jgi:hypothetical protein